MPASILRNRWLVLLVLLFIIGGLVALTYLPSAAIGYAVYRLTSSDLAGYIVAGGVGGGLSAAGSIYGSAILGAKIGTVAGGIIGATIGGVIGGL